jgi:hypothetical protein
MPSARLNAPQQTRTSKLRADAAAQVKQRAEQQEDDKPFLSARGLVTKSDVKTKPIKNRASL